MNDARELLKRVWRWRIAYVFVAPFFLLYLAFGIYPSLYSLYLSFHRWHGLDTMRFVGLRNYANIITDAIFWKTVYNLLWYWTAIVPATLALGLILAALLNAQWLRARSFFRTLYVLPYVTSVVVVGIVFRGLLETNYGAVNHYLGLLGMQPVPWLQSPAWSKVSVASLVLWKSIGFSMVVYLGGLQTVPNAMYEAAAIDGASRLQQFLRITLPLVKPVTLFLLIIHTIGVFNLFGEAYLLTEGGPRNSSTTLTLEIYANGFRYFKIGYAAALSFVLLLLVAVTSLVQFYAVGRGDEA